ncbi:MAG: hypothetical protein DRN06_06240 [Thermoprotei archaeon]|nr:MAG: hypothetical protein DRN06_06240 [Thermoprotei archaeon]
MNILNFLHENLKPPAILKAQVGGAMSDISCKTCLKARKTRPDGAYLCEYYGIWVTETSSCMAYVPKE